MAAWATVSSICFKTARHSLIYVYFISENKISSDCVFPGSSEDQTTPMLVTALKGLKVMDVACGSGDAQTLAVTENGKNNFFFFELEFCPKKPSAFLFIFSVVLQVRCGPGGTETMENWAEEAVMAARPPNWWRNCRIWT